jgi:exodeoxyribonuclease VII large subunit
MLSVLTGEQTALTATRSRLTTLGPAATLARGYAVLQVVDEDGVALGGDHIVRSVSQLGPGTKFRVRVVDGAIHAVVSEHVGDQNGESESGR